MSLNIECSDTSIHKMLLNDNIIGVVSELQHESYVSRFEEVTRVGKRATRGLYV